MQAQDPSTASQDVATLQSCPDSHERPAATDPEAAGEVAAPASPSAKQLAALARQMRMPLCIASHRRFFGAAPATGFDRRLLNAWFRRNGFQRPWHVYTILHGAAWLVLAPPLFCTVQAQLAGGGAPPPLVAAAHACLATLAAAGLAASVAAMTIDPQDPAVARAREPRNLDYVKTVGIPVIDAGGFCAVCCVVVDSRTRHCK
ncbi:hypothetical protein HK405_012262, partial [Cladochytrium tenue]